MLRGLTSALAIAVAIAAQAQAAPPAPEAWSRIKAAGVLRVGLTGDYPPYAFADEAGEFAGADVDVLREFAGRQGLAISFVKTRWKTLLPDFVDGQFDIAVGGVSVTSERAAAGAFSHVLLVDEKRPLVRCADVDRFTRLEAINQPTVRVMFNPGGANEAFDRAHFAAATLIEQANNLAIPDAMERHEADVFVTDRVEAEMIHMHHTGLCVARTDEAWAPLQKAFLIPRDATFEAALNAVIDEDVDSGRYRDRVSRYMERQPQK